jgi:2-phosphoglycerate kinase
MVKVQKREEEFEKSKVENSIKAAGATPEEAANIAEEISKKVAKRKKISSDEIFDMAVRALNKVNKTAAKEFRRYRAEKLKPKK